MQNIPLAQLTASPINVRKTGGVSIEALAASIHAHGLLQNLTVVGYPNGYEVTSGGRRLRALQHLAKAGQIHGDYPVPCNVVGEVGAAEKSIAENVIREAMHPADEFDAFAGMVKNGSTIEDVATRFGCEEIHVRQRLQLANVAPEIITDYRAGVATLKQVMALAITNDQDAQRKVWKAARHEYDRKPQALRAALTSKEVAIADDTRAKYVGIKAYIAAGGQVRLDLFANDEPTHMTDPQLLDQLVVAKLEKRAEKLRAEGWKWVEVIPSFSYQDEAKFSKEHGNYIEGKRVFSDTVKAFAGCVVSLGYNGTAEICMGLVKASDKKAAPASSDTGKIVKEKAKAKEAAGGLPFAEIQRLQGYRTAVVRGEIRHNKATALAALAASLLEESHDLEIDSAIRLAPFHETVPATIRNVLEDSDENRDLQDELDAWRLQFRALDPGFPTMFEWLLSEPVDVSINIIVLCTASTFLLADTYQPMDEDPGRAFAKLAGVSFAGRWKPTLEWIQTVRKGVLVEILTEAAGKLIGAAATKLSGAALHAFAFEHLAESGWLPKPLRAPDPVKPKKVRAPKKAPQPVE